MKIARFVINDRPLEGVFENDQLLADGIAYDLDDVIWQPPVERTATAIGVALGYADHAQELDIELPDIPILFHKMPNTFIGHKAQIVAPADIEYMHYECELVAVIGHTARHIKAEQALDYIKGYTIGNDVTIRDFVTDYYRPPVKAKGFDTFGPIGPFLVTSDEIDPTNVELRTYVNGQLRQRGNTKYLRHSVAELVEYISEFMTLEPGDMIWTGTPKGISHIYPGDLLQLEIDGLGALENEVVGG